MTEKRMDWTFIGPEDIEPLDNGEVGFRLNGLSDISGTFAGALEDGVNALLSNNGEPITLYLYGADPNLPWWKHWFYRIRERLTDRAYPTVVIACGPANMKFDKEVEDGEDVVFSGTFTKAGQWEFHDKKEVNQ